MNTNLTGIQKLTELKTKLYSTQIQFISSINSIFTHIDGYIQSYSNDTTLQQPSNTDIQSHLKYSETQFDQINEIMKRNDNILQIQSKTKSIIEKYSTLLNDPITTASFKQMTDVTIENHKVYQFNDATYTNSGLEIY